MKSAGVEDTSSTTMAVREDSAAGLHAVQSNGTPLSANIPRANHCARALMNCGSGVLTFTQTAGFWRDSLPSAVECAIQSNRAIRVLIIIRILLCSEHWAAWSRL